MPMSERYREELPRLTELPEPYEGVVEEIFFDLLVDRAVYIHNSLTNFREENPYLISALITDLTSSPNSDLSSNWLLSYYEIFSRSARKMGKMMLLVSKEVIETYDEKDVQELKSIDARRSQVDAIRHKELSIRNRNKLIKGEVLSNELASFWAHQRMFHTRLLMSGEKSDKIGLIFEGLYLAQAYIHAQQEANSLGKKFPL